MDRSPVPLSPLPRRHRLTLTDNSPLLDTPPLLPPVIARSMFSTLLQKLWCSYGSLLVLVDIAILLNRIGKVSKCQWLTNCLVFSSF